jgi:capsid protein
MKLIDRIKNIWANGENAPVKGKKMSRSFKGGRLNRFTNWINATLTRVNADVNQDLLNTITKCRDLAKNDPIVRAYLSACQKNIIGKAGLTLQSQMKKSEEDLDEKLNDEIEWMFYDWGKAMNGYLTVDGQTGHNDFDALILRTLLIDGEVFIRIHREVKNPYGLSFELIDSASIDYTKIRESSQGQNAIVLGVEVDKYYKPVAYYVKPR